MIVIGLPPAWVFRTNCSVNVMDWIVVRFYGHLPAKDVNTSCPNGAVELSYGYGHERHPDRTLHKVSIAQKRIASHPILLSSLNLPRCIPAHHIITELLACGRRYNPSNSTGSNAPTPYNNLDGLRPGNHKVPSHPNDH